MPEAAEFCPTFDRPPVVETRIGVQFKPLSGVRAAHFGMFWRDCLGIEAWHPNDDLAMLKREVERFDTLELNPPPEDLGEIDSLGVRAVFRSQDERRTVHFQPDRLAYSIVRQGSPRPSYTDLRGDFDPLFARFLKFAGRYGLGDVRPDLWEIAYTNAIPMGTLWQTPADWHRVFPGLFKPDPPRVAGLDWATFEGEWYFTMPDQAGRVRLKALKAVANATGQVVLLVYIKARGSLDDGSGRTWAEGLDLGHRSAVRVFYDLSSPEALAEWGCRS